MKINTPTPEQMNESIEAWAPVEQAYREDPGFRRRLAEDAAAAVAEKGLELPRGVSELKILENTPEVFHLAFPCNPNSIVSDDSLDQVSGGGRGPQYPTEPPVGPRFSYQSPVTGEEVFVY